MSSVAISSFVKKYGSNRHGLNSWLIIGNLDIMPVTIYLLEGRDPRSRRLDWMSSGQLLTIEEMSLRLGIREARNSCLLLEKHDTVRASKLEVGNLMTFLNGLALEFLVHYNRRHLGHADGQDGHLTQRFVLNDNPTSRLKELVSGGVGSVDRMDATLCLLLFDFIAVADQTTRLQVVVAFFLVLLDDHFQVGGSLDRIDLENLSADWGMLTMIVERVEETMHPDPTLENVFVIFTD